MNLSGTKLLAALLCAALLAGCSTWQWHWPAWMKSASGNGTSTGYPTMPPDSVAGILYFVGGVLALPHAERAEAYQAAQQRYAANHGAADRLRLALLAALLPQPEQDTDGARILLSNYSWQTTQPGYAGLAAITLDVLDRQQQTQQQAADKVSQAQTELAEVQRDNARLQKQLDALKAIEKTLNSRGPRFVGDGQGAPSHE